MATEPIYAQRRPGFPRESVDAGSYRTQIEYVGLARDLRAASPNINTVWGDYNGLVSLAELEPLDGTDYAILIVWVEYKFEAASYEAGGGTLQSTNYEIDWLTVQRSLFEHKDFRIGAGGAYQLTSKDVSEIGKWQAMTNAGYKADYYFYIDGETGSTSELSDNAKMLARGIQIGIEYWEDKVPVARRSRTYVNGPGPSGEAGKKDTPTGFPNLPPGYEWIRDSDRSLKTGTQSKWQNDTEWLGAKKVLIDTENIYWAAP